MASSVAETAEDAWDSAKESCQSMASATARQAENFLDEATHLVRRNPTLALLCAFGVGYLASAAIRTSSRH